MIALEKNPVKSYALAFTWTPRPSKELVSPKKQFHETMRDGIYFLRYCSEGIMYPELNLNGNIHYHGMLNITDVVHWYKDILPRLKRGGYVQMKQITDQKGWETYIAKSDKDMQKILRLKKLPITWEPVKFKKVQRVYPPTPLDD